jgi:archaellum component FlaF (FlaF/FlaG flagellin family)
MTPIEKKRAKILLGIIAAICGVYLFFKFFDLYIGNKNAYDKVEKENEKLIPLFYSSLNKEIEMYKSGWYSGCRKTAYLQVENLFTTIKEVATYTRYGLASKQSHNRVLVQVLYNDGKKVNDLYTDVSWNGSNIMGYPLLLKYVFENGKIVKAFSNGIEIDKSPSEAKAPIDDIVNAIIHQDYKDNKSFYFLPDKTKDDFKKEWDKVK